MASLAELNAEGYNDSSDYVTCPQKEVTVVFARCVVQCRRCMGGSQLRGSRSYRLLSSDWEYGDSSVVRAPDS